MSGHVFHPGHDELHGITVVVEAAEGRTLVGRWHEQTLRGVLLHDVAVHESTSSTLSKEEWLAKLRKYGVAVDLKHAIVPPTQLLGVRRLTE